MDYLVWKEEYNLKIEKIDKQHFSWAKLINKLYDARNTQQAASMMLNVFNEMVTTMKEHFKTEEGLLEENKCPEISVMRKAHQEVFNRAVKIKDEFMKFRDPADLAVFLKFLREYFINHTQKMDRKYIAFLKYK